MRKQKKNESGRLTRWIFSLLALILLVASLLHLNIMPERIVESFNRGMQMINTMIPPTLNEPVNVFEAAIESIQVAVIGTLFGIIFSITLAFFAARNTTPHMTISYALKAFAGLVRAVPALIWVLLFIVAVGLGPTPGIMALAVNSIGMLLKIYAEAIEEIDKGVIEAIQATGGSRFQVIMQGIVPSIASIFVSWSVFRFDINIRYASVLGMVGAGGIGWELMRAAQMADYAQVVGVTFVIFLMIISVEYVSRFVRNQFSGESVKTA